MPRFTPSVLISDCWGSMGDLTFYHVDGRCYYKNKSRCSFPGTAAQQSSLDVNRRALAAWREIPHETQKICNSLAEPVISHKPPFDGTSLRLRFKSFFPEGIDASRYQILMKNQLAKPGYGRKPGLMRNFLAEAPCSSGEGTASFLIDDYANRWK